MHRQARSLYLKLWLTISVHCFVAELIQAVQIRLEAGRGENKFVADGKTSTRNLKMVLIWVSKILLLLCYVTWLSNLTTAPYLGGMYQILLTKRWKSWRIYPLCVSASVSVWECVTMCVHVGVSASVSVWECVHMWLGVCLRVWACESVCTCGWVCACECGHVRVYVNMCIWVCVCERERVCDWAWVRLSVCVCVCVCVCIREAECVTVCVWGGVRDVSASMTKCACIKIKLYNFYITRHKINFKNLCQTVKIYRLTKGKSYITRYSKLKLSYAVLR
jgi:hypothetical protein